MVPGGRFDEETGKGRIVMPLASHLSELKRKHGELEREITDAIAHPSTDDLEVASLKRRKLALKDQIEKLTQQQTRH
jgi:hypothetical protein